MLPHKADPAAGGPSAILCFHPIVKEKVWGGRRLERVLGKTLPGSGPYGESWEIADLGPDRTAVAGGPWDRQSLHDLVAKHPLDILGRESGGGFPLLFKVIDAAGPLSLQVHPGDEDRPGEGKTEAWVILEAPLGAQVAHGLVAGASRDHFFDLLEKGDHAAAEGLVAKHEVKPGDIVYLPAGTIHAIGPGILLLEVQESSDVTYRIHDWNRPGLDGRPRPLQLKEARAVRARPTGIACPYADTSGLGPGLRPLIECPAFRMSGFRLSRIRPTMRATTREGDGRRFLVLGGVEGRAKVRTLRGQDELELERGGFLLVPAAAEEIQIRAADGFTGILVQEGPG
jgi:mannose-6-phosphate isomerase